MKKLTNNTKLTALTRDELKNTEGGWLLFVAGAFVVTTAYGYVKEKLDSGQW